MFKKETTRSQKIMNGVKNVASTAGAIGLATLYVTGAAIIEAEEQNRRRNATVYNTSSGYNAMRSNNSGYNSTRNATADISRSFMEDFIKSFGSLNTRVERGMRSGYLSEVGYHSGVFHNYYCKADFQIACEGDGWKLFAAVAPDDTLYMVLTNRFESIIDVASCNIEEAGERFDIELLNNRRVRDIQVAVAKILR